MLAPIPGHGPRRERVDLSPSAHSWPPLPVQSVMEQSIVFAGMTTVIGAGISVRATLAAIGPPLRAKLAFAER
jgi:hypothetical protein